MPPTAQFNVTIEDGDQPSSRTVKVSGELDSGNCDSVVEAINEAIAGHAERLELDLAEVSFIDSAGTRALILIERSAQEGGVELVVVPPPEEVTALLRTAGVTERVNLAATAASVPRGGEFVERVELEFPREPRSPARARGEVRETLTGILDDEQLANVVLLTSELVTNAVVHPRAEVEEAVLLRITTYEDGIRVEVEDAGEGFDPAAPVVRATDGGRGLFLVDACSSSWGTRHEHTERGRRFRVWFELSPSTAEAATALPT